MGLKKRLGGIPLPPPQGNQACIIELVAPQATALEECVVEFGPRGGAKCVSSGSIGAARLGKPAARLAETEDDSDRGADTDSGCVEAIDGRKGIDAIAQLCREK